MAEIRKMKAITRYAYTEDGFTSNESRYVALERHSYENQRLLAPWTNKANQTNYQEAYNLFRASCFTGACGRLRSIFENRTKRAVVDRCPNFLSALPIGSNFELVHLRPFGLILNSASWTNLKPPGQ